MNSDNLPAPINKIPFGLLSFFGIKSGGRYPSELRDSLQPVIDMLRHYVETNSEEYALLTTQLTPGNYDLQQMDWTSTLPTNISNGTSVNVAQNEAWYVTQYNVRCQFNGVAGSTMDASPEVVPINGSHRIGGVLQGYQDSALGYVRGGCRSIIEPIWVLPGSRISVRRWGGVVAVGGTVDITGTVRFARFKF